MKLDMDRTEVGRSEINISGQLDLEWADDRPSSAQISGNLTVDNLEQRYLLSGKLEANGRCTCVRCLEEFELTWTVPVEIMVLRNVDTDEGQDETMVLHQESGEVDLRETLRESLLLAYPAATICRPECQGICVQCGVDLNKEACTCADDDVDPRWAGLDALDHK